MTGEAQDAKINFYPQPLLTVFWSAVSVFAFLILYIFINSFIEGLNGLFRYIFFPGIIILTLLGIVLIVLAAKSGVKSSLRLSFILTGSAVAGMPICAVLHNVVYGVFIYLFGENFWGANGDEAFFFIMALIVCPLLLVVSVISAIVIMVRSRTELVA